MNILYITIIDFSSINDRGTYPDLIREFVRNGHHVFIMSPSEGLKKKSTRLIEDEKVKILKPSIRTIQRTNFVIKGISTLLLGRILVKSIEKFFADVKFDLVIYGTPPITINRVVEFIKRRDKAVAYLLLKDIFPQNSIDIQILSKSGIKGLLYKFFKFKEKQLYKTADYIGVCPKQTEATCCDIVNFLIRKKSKFVRM